MTKETVFYYLHGFQAIFDLESPKVKAFSELLPTVGLTVDYLNQEDLDRLEKDVENTLKTKNIIFVGSSLGGYFARYFAEKYNLSSILLNPSLSPISALKKDGYSKTKTLHLKNYNSHHNNDSPSLLLLAKNDNVVHYEETIYAIGKNSIVILKDSGGHRLSNIKEFMPDVALFIESSINNTKKPSVKV